MIRVAIATTSAADDPDLALLTGALGDLGVDAVPVAWDDPAFDWDVVPVVVRSTWDYASRVTEFLAWAAAVRQLHNPLAVIAWNADKHYLDDLAARGVPTVPTAYVRSGDEAAFPEGRFVVKPTVGAGSRGASRFDATEHTEGRAHVDALAALGLTSMVQPYLAGIEAGETGVVVVDGVVSHAVRKHARMGVDAASMPAGPVSVEAVEPSGAQLAVVDAVLRALPLEHALCYARVDLVDTDAGPVVLEVELIEPFLFLETRDGAAATLASAIARRAGVVTGGSPAARRHTPSA